MKRYVKPLLEIVELEAESALLTASHPHVVEDSAGFGDPTDEID